MTAINIATGEDKPIRTITNNYLDARVLNLGSDNERGPYLVTQIGIAPNNPLRLGMFLLRRDGRWVDFNCYACQRRPEAMDEIAFPDIPTVLRTFAQLAGKPRVLEMPIDRAGLRDWVMFQGNRDPIQSARVWAGQYRPRHRERARH